MTTAGDDVTQRFVVAAIDSSVNALKASNLWKEQVAFVR